MPLYAKVISGDVNYQFSNYGKDANCSPATHHFRNDSGSIFVTLDPTMDLHPRLPHGARNVGDSTAMLGERCDQACISLLVLNLAFYEKQRTAVGGTNQPRPIMDRP